jgi:hypothetical protein
MAAKMEDSFMEAKLDRTDLKNPAFAAGGRAGMGNAEIWPSG